MTRLTVDIKNETLEELHIDHSETLTRELSDELWKRLRKPLDIDLYKVENKLKSERGVK